MSYLHFSKQELYQSYKRFHQRFHLPSSQQGGPDLLAGIYAVEIGIKVLYLHRHSFHTTARLEEEPEKKTSFFNHYPMDLAEEIHIRLRFSS